jgi:23S rRNA (guanosine2251-2'-O)-methyltransferase
VSSGISGYHAIEEIIKNRRLTGGVLYFSGTSNRTQALVAAANNKKIRVEKVSNQNLVQISENEDVRNVYLVFNKAENLGNSIESMFESISSNPDKKRLYIVLDGITDPHNMGAILRSADHFAVDGVILPEKRSASINETVIKVSSGASEYISIYTVTNIVRIIKKFKENNFWIYGAEMNGVPLTSCDFDGKCVLILGSEGKGISRLLSDNCDIFVSIPSKGHIDSFNVSVAAGILMYEIRRAQNLII